ncbi:MAG: hypothetical protein HY900_14060 [Deltaproteobacteria bacterium]|nr:hypothetical protein [Deltaproteobacteria bacterium]
MNGKKDRMELQVGLKKAVQWIDEQRREHPERSLAKLIDEAGLKFELSPLEADFLYRHFT